MTPSGANTLLVFHDHYISRLSQAYVRLVDETTDPRALLCPNSRTWRADGRFRSAE
jgi:hypothetical protein